MCNVWTTEFQHMIESFPSTFLFSAVNCFVWKFPSAFWRFLYSTASSTNVEAAAARYLKSWILIVFCVVADHRFVYMQLWVAMLKRKLWTQDGKQKISVFLYSSTFAFANGTSKVFLISYETQAPASTKPWLWIKFWLMHENIQFLPIFLLANQVSIYEQATQCLCFWWWHRANTRNQNPLRVSCFLLHTKNRITSSQVKLFCFEISWNCGKVLTGLKASCRCEQVNEF